MSLTQFGASIRRGLTAAWKHFIKRPWMRPFDEFCQEFNGKVVSTNLLPARCAEFRHGPFVITLSCAEGEDTTSTSASVKFKTVRPLAFSMAPSGLLATRAKSLLFPRFVSGYRPFDDQVAVFGADHAELTRILSDEELRLLLAKYKDVHVSVAHQPRHESFTLTRGSSQGSLLLTAEVSSALAERERYRDLVELIRLLLDQLYLLEIVVLEEPLAP